jgi:hypothetical protein
MRTITSPFFLRAMVERNWSKFLISMRIFTGMIRAPLSESMASSLRGMVRNSFFRLHLILSAAKSQLDIVVQGLENTVLDYRFLLKRDSRKNLTELCDSLNSRMWIHCLSWSFSIALLLISVEEFPDLYSLEPSKNSLMCSGPKLAVDSLRARIQVYFPFG